MGWVLRGGAGPADIIDPNDSAPKMKNLFSALFVLAVACATAPAQAQAAKQAPAGGSKSVEARVAMCMGCHSIKGYEASFPEVHKVPMIAGQSAKYIAAALNAY